MAINKMRVSDIRLDGNVAYSKRVQRRMAARKRDLERTRQQEPPPDPLHEMVQTRDDQGLEYDPTYHKKARYFTDTKTVGHSGAGPCTVHTGTGVTRLQHAEYALGYLLAEYINKQPGHHNGGLAWILFTEAEPSQSGKYGHHDYREYPIGGSRMADFCDKIGPVFGEFFRSPPRGTHTASGTGLRVLAYAPPPLKGLGGRIKARLTELEASATTAEKAQLAEFRKGYNALNGW